MNKNADIITDAHIQLNKLTKFYREGDSKRLVLDELDLRVAEGEILVLLGRSGSGKSTLLNLISGIDKPSSGEVIIGGTDLTTLNEKNRTLYRRKNIGFVFQSFNLISTLTAEENVLLPLRLKGDNGVGGKDGNRGKSENESESKNSGKSGSEGKGKNNHQATVQKFLNEVGLGDRGDSYPDRLSGGEQQRVAIARALANEPMLILADEPTGNLDYQTGQTILEMLHTLVRQNGRTIILATHDHEICKIADRVLELREGTLKHVDGDGAAGPVGQSVQP